MADLILEKLYKTKYFTWSSSNLVKANEIREKYIKALQQADSQNYEDLIAFAKS